MTSDWRLKKWLEETILTLDPDEGLSPEALWGLQELVRAQLRPDEKLLSEIAHALADQHPTGWKFTPAALHDWGNRIGLLERRIEFREQKIERQAEQITRLDASLKSIREHNDMLRLKLIAVTGREPVDP